MWFVVPAGLARRCVVMAGVIFVLGWLSGLGQHGPTNVRPIPAAVVRPSDRAVAGSAPGHGPTPVRTTACGRANCAGSRSGWSGVLPVVGCGASRCVPLRFGPSPAVPPAAPAVDCKVVKCVALTFDDGPGPYTTKLLDMLAARHVRVTFFLIGGNIRGREAIVRREVADGHVIGDHTWSHPDLTKMSADAVRSQLRRTLTEIRLATGGSTRLMRPPYGATDKHVGAVAREFGLSQIIWSVDTNDWLDRNSAIVAGRAVNWPRRGDIVLMHDIHPTTVAAVPRILRGLARRGFTFVTVPELLAAHPLTPGKAYFDGR